MPYMNRPFFYIILIVATTCLAGCTEQNSKRAAPIDGIKLSDLAPANSMALPPEIFFQMFVFEMPAENFTSIKDIFKDLSTGPLRFVNKDTFRANGFEAGFGYNKMWDGIGRRLRELNARKVMTKNIFIFDDDAYDIPIAIANHPQTMIYIAKDRTITTADFTSGQFIWRIKAKAIAQRRATAGITIMPVFKNKGLGRFTKMIKNAPSGETVFGSAAFGLNISDEDFVLIGPSRYNKGQLTLCDSFFTRTRDYIANEPSQHQAGGISLNKPVTMKKEIPMIRLYMIICVRVGN